VPASASAYEFDRCPFTIPVTNFGNITEAIGVVNVTSPIPTMATAA
jgi:hypothetical protein